MTTAVAVAADSSSTLATTLVSEEDEERARTTTTPPAGFEAMSLSSLSSSSVVEVSGATQKLTSYNGMDGGGDVFAQRKLIKSSKKVKHPEALCTLSLFADSLFLYANKCFTDIMVTISPCDETDDTCYISERLPPVPQEEQEENQEEEPCFVGGAFPAKQNIQYNPSTGECEFLYVDLAEDPCNSYKGDTGTGSLGLKARINVKTNPDVMFIQFTKDKGLTFYNTGDERIATRSKTTHNDRYLRQEGANKPVLSMMPHPFASGHRRLYSKVSVKNDTPYEANSIRVEYCACTKDENSFIASGGTWTVETYRGGCLATEVHSTLRLPDGTDRNCLGYWSSGTGISEFYIMWIDDVCCLRSSEQSNTECTKQIPFQNDDDCDPSKANGLGYGNGCETNDCAHPDWLDGCEACMCFNKAMTPGAMATEVIFMIITLRNTEIIHGVIPIGETGNAIPSLNH